MSAAARELYGKATIVVKRGAITGGTPSSGDPGIPAGRLGTGDDITAAFMFLCSEGSGYFSGQLVAVNGGAVMTA